MRSTTRLAMERQSERRRLRSRGSGFDAGAEPPKARTPQIKYATQGQLAEQVAKLAKATQADFRGPQTSMLAKLEQRDLRIAMLERRLAEIEGRAR